MNNIYSIKDQTANPGPLGLFGFAMTTVLLNIHNAGFFPVNSMIMGMGVFFGGGAQFVAGVMEWKKGNNFGSIAFMSYGAFWLTLVFSTDVWRRKTRRKCDGMLFRNVGIIYINQLFTNLKRQFGRKTIIRFINLIILFIGSR